MSTKRNKRTLNLIAYIASIVQTMVIAVNNINRNGHRLYSVPSSQSEAAHECNND